MRSVHLLGPADTPELRRRLEPVQPEAVEVRPVPRALLRVWPKWAAAMSVPWRVWVRPDVLYGNPAFLAEIVAHELVHVRQWRTNGVVGFLRHYLADYARGRLNRLGHLGAYRAIRFETEAYDVAASARSGQSITMPDKSPSGSG